MSKKDLIRYILLTQISSIIIITVLATGKQFNYILIPFVMHTKTLKYTNSLTISVFFMFKQFKTKSCHL